MVNLMRRFAEVGMRRDMDEHRRVKGWLSELRSEDSKDEKLEQLGDTPNPVTPPRPPHTYQQVDDISPTDTSFSGGSLFDTPLREYYQPSSPCAPRRFRDDVSEATTCDETKEQDWNTRVKHCTEGFQLPSFESPRLQPASLNSYDPLSEDEHDLGQALSTSSTPPPHDPGQPRLVNILSCLQCTSANLPCSRTTPSCTRCIRNNRSSTCVLLRRHFPEEIHLSDPDNCTSPVLLKLKNEDPEHWAERMSAAERLRREWVYMQDKMNWVLPRIESEERGNWRIEGRVERAGMKWPSEGMGRVVFEELLVDEELVMI